MTNVSLSNISLRNCEQRINIRFESPCHHGPTWSLVKKIAEEIVKRHISLKSITLRAHGFIDRAEAPYSPFRSGWLFEINETQYIGVCCFPNENNSEQITMRIGLTKSIRAFFKKHAIERVMIDGCHNLLPREKLAFFGSEAL